MAGEWTQQELNAIVADHFAMLVKEIAGGRYNKAEHRRTLLRSISRTEASIEFKHRNISAALKLLGEPVIIGYLPAWNYQRSLFDTVARWLDRHADWLPLPVWQLPNVVSDAAGEARRGDAEQSRTTFPQLFIGPAPVQQNELPPLEPALISEIGRRYDVAGRDARNTALGDAGEELVFEHESRTLHAQGRAHLARKVRWTAKEDGDGYGYDIASFEADGRDRLIEVKTTNGWERAPFYISANEIRVAEDRRDHWRLVRVWNFAREPRAFELRPPLDAALALSPASFLAQLR